MNTIDKIKIAAACLLSTVSALALPTAGMTYRICPTENVAKSLFVQNASLDVDAPVVVWSETDVPAQQWTCGVNSTGTRFYFTNVYTGYYLAVTDGKVKQSRTIVFFNVDEKEDGTYTLSNLSRNLNLTSLTDGTQAISASKAEYTWTFIETEPQTEFNTSLRERMGMGFINQYRQQKGALRYTFCNGGWGESETQEAILDMVEATGNEFYRRTYKGAYDYFRESVGGTWTGGASANGYHWYGYDFNDDVMWQIIGAARAYNLLGYKQCLTDAKKNFKLIYDRAYMPYCGLMRWAENSGDRNGANSCINGPTEIAACYIGIAEADESYFEIAKNLYAKQRQHLFNPNDGHVYDACVFDPATGKVKSTNYWASTYNQGTMLGAAVLLYQHYGDEMYRQDADKILDYARKNLCDNHGIIKVCQDADGDFQGFKGILMRYAGLYARVFDSEDTREWLRKNAFHAYNNMNSKYFGHSAWLTKAAEDGIFLKPDNGSVRKIDYTTQPFGASTAVSAAYACPVPEPAETAIKPVTTVQEANDNHWYSLSGVRVTSDHLKPGIYIHKNKKVLVK